MEQPEVDGLPFSVRDDFSDRVILCPYFEEHKLGP